VTKLPKSDLVVSEFIVFSIAFAKKQKVTAAQDDDERQASSREDGVS
jgi:hypothetical protein